MKSISLISMATLCLAGCAATGPESLSVEHKGKTTIVHHRSRTSKGARDRIEAISDKGVVSQAVVEVYDIGRLPDGNGGMSEAHRYYRVAHSPSFDLRIPKKSSTHASGPKTVWTPPNYVPPPNDQRINDAVAEAQKAKDKLEAAAKQVQDRLKDDNALRGELQTEIDENQRLRDQLNAGMATPKHQPQGQSDAEKAAQAAVDPLATWGASINHQ